MTDRHVLAGADWARPGDDESRTYFFTDAQLNVTEVQFRAMTQLRAKLGMSLLSPCKVHVMQEDMNLQDVQDALDRMEQARKPVLELSADFRKEAARIRKETNERVARVTKTEGPARGKRRGRNLRRFN